MPAKPLRGDGARSTQMLQADLRRSLRSGGDQEPEGDPRAFKPIGREMSDSGARCSSSPIASVGLVTSTNDSYLARQRANDFTGQLAAANGINLYRYKLPESWNIGHDIVDPAGLGAHHAELDDVYFDLYEGRAPDRR
ncbi:hypothetical protein ACQPWW_13185 [Micromonospora sp. CA-240977]|uniref:hypothetical protein n=1 Tax=Micromonospora sp. CA-240977 TaxID=3239957 RepID=UPI003D89EBF5